MKNQNQIKLKNTNQKSNLSHKLAQERLMDNTWLDELKSSNKGKRWPHDEDKDDSDTFKNIPTKDYVVRKGYRINKIKRQRLVPSHTI